MKKLELNTFSEIKREKLLDYKVYEYGFDTATLKTFKKVGEGLAKALAAGNIPAVNLMAGTQERAWQTVGHLSNCYSAGHNFDELRAFYPTALEYWESYAHFSRMYRESPEGAMSEVGHIELGSEEYHFALILVCFGILLGWSNLLHRIAPLIDYRNPEADALLERLLDKYVDGRNTSISECCRHLPYFKTLKLFNMAAEDRPAAMSEYLGDWYEASRREPYYDSHKRGNFFKGYWSWEAAAITVLLDIDDTSYRDAQFYPRDLVDFARRTQKDYAPPGTPAIEQNELRAKAGDPCPKAGMWQSLDVDATRKRFELEQPMPDLNSAYGLTVWFFIEG